MNKGRNREFILAIIKKRKNLEKKDISLHKGDYEAPWESTPHTLNYWKFLKDLEEGKIKHLSGKRVG